MATVISNQQKPYTLTAISVSGRPSSSPWRCSSGQFFTDQFHLHSLLLCARFKEIITTALLCLQLFTSYHTCLPHKPSLRPFASTLHFYSSFAKGENRDHDLLRSVKSKIKDAEKSNEAVRFWFSPFVFSLLFGFVVALTVCGLLVLKTAVPLNFVFRNLISKTIQKLSFCPTRNKLLKLYFFSDFYAGGSLAFVCFLVNVK